MTTLQLPQTFGILPAAEVRRLVQARGTELDAPARDRWLSRLATRQHGVVSRSQLLALGFTARQVGLRVRAGRLLPAHRGVYAVGHARLTLDGHAMAAVLAVSEEAAIGHVSALQRRKLLAGERASVDVVVPTQAGRVGKRAGLLVHRTRGLLPGDVEQVRGVPTTSTTRTLVDVAPFLAPSRWDRALDTALKRGIDLGELAARSPRARTTLGESVVAPTRSELEDLFLAVLDEAGLPRPEVNADVQRRDGLWMQVDAIYRRPRPVAIELDSRTHHLTDLAWRRDAERDRQLGLAGWLVLRYPWFVVVHRPQDVVSELRDLLAG